MYQCPICQSKYVESKVNFCSTCGWDLTPYPLTFAGQIPEAFLEKERAKLVWAREIWAKSQSELEQLTRSQSQLEQVNEEKTQLQFQLTQVFSQLERVNYERTQEALSKLQARLDEVQAQQQQTDQEQREIQFQLSQTKEDGLQFKSRLLQIESEMGQVKELQLNINVDVKSLTELAKKEVMTRIARSLKNIIDAKSRNITLLKR